MMMKHGACPPSQSTEALTSGRHFSNLAASCDKSYVTIFKSNKMGYYYVNTFRVVQVDLSIMIQCMKNVDNAASIGGNMKGNAEGAGSCTSDGRDA